MWREYLGELDGIIGDLRIFCSTYASGLVQLMVKFIAAVTVAKPKSRSTGLKPETAASIFRGRLLVAKTKSRSTGLKCKYDQATVCL